MNVFRSFMPLVLATAGLGLTGCAATHSASQSSVVHGSPYLCPKCGQRHFASHSAEVASSAQRKSVESRPAPQPHLQQSPPAPQLRLPPTAPPPASPLKNSFDAALPSGGAPSVATPQLLPAGQSSRPMPSDGEVEMQLRQRLSYIRNVRQADPRRTELHLVEAELLRRLGDTRGELFALQAAVLANPRSADVQAKAGRGFLRAGDEQRGFAALGRSVQLAPYDPRYAHGLAAAHLSAGSPDSAIVVLEAAAARTPDPSISVSLGRLYEAQRDWTAATGAYRSALHGRPGDVRTTVRLAECLYHSGSYEHAVQRYQQAAQVDRRWLSFAEYSRYGDAALRSEHLQLAGDVFDYMAENTPPMRELEILRALAALRLGESSRAERIARTALTQWENDEQLSRVLELSGAIELTAATADTVAESDESEFVQTADYSALPLCRPVVEPDSDGSNSSSTSSSSSDVLTSTSPSN
ncbi:tetratricopeptide repeat protein [Stratiformator vulcanicus]|uniref:Uncharacterized protein n=1 Tax=Stratiformator vulcanicus TaxID=2527980 RepID=A0A517R557_9PLAN|nr:tetratricopeptide repeat protein [Stratiformator vulcanicus]QDT38980.1 hypothetical protein Pan189_33800 [Stratiformator vulcanicus]